MNTNVLVSRLFGIVIIAAAIFAVTVALPVTPALAQEVTEDSAATTQTEKEATDTKKSEEKPVIYEYVAQPGDSYTKMARKAVQTYGKKYEVKLSGAQIVFAETNLTIAAGSPELLIGQEVTVSEADILNWIEKAKELTDDQKAAWEVYAVNVDFNTDDIGQSS